MLLLFWILNVIWSTSCEVPGEPYIVENEDRSRIFREDESWEKIPNNSISFVLGDDASIQTSFKYRPPELELQFLHMNIDGLTIGTKISPEFSNMAELLGGILLHTAVEENDLNMIESLVDIGASVNLEDNLGLTALYRALMRNSAETTKLLIDAGASINFVSSSGDSLLHASVNRNDLIVLQRLLQLGAEVDSPNSDGVTPLFKAVESSNRQAIETLLSRSADVDWKSDAGQSLLHIAVIKGRMGVAEELIRLGGKVDSVDSQGATPLYAALLSDNPILVKMLVDHGANSSFISPKGESLVHKAVSEGRVDVLQKLAILGADLYSLDTDAHTPLEVAIKMNRTDAMRALIRSKLDVNKRNPSTGESPLHFAVSNGTIDTLQVLVANGAETFVMNEDGLTPLISAIFLDKTEMIDLLYKSSPEVNYRSNNNGNTPLHFAVMREDLLSVEKLLKRGALVDALNKEGLTPLCKAALRNCANIIKLLIKNGANMNFKSAFGDTPLHLAVSERSISAVVVLAELGANLNEVDARNMTPLCKAIALNATNVFNALLSKKASVKVLCSGEYPVYLAVRNSTLAVVKRLISLGNVFNPSTIVDRAVESNNPKVLDYFLTLQGPSSEDELSRLLLLAASSGSPDVVRELLKVGAAVDVMSDTGFTPIWYAVMNRKPSAVRVLVEKKPDLQKTVSYFRDGLDLRGWTLVHEAAFNGDGESLEVLLDAGVDIDAKDDRAWTPLHYAAAQHNLDIIRLLVARGANPGAKTRHGELPGDLLKRRRSYDPAILECLTPLGESTT